MASNKVSYSLSIKDKNGDIFEFTYEGIPKRNDINNEKIQKLITKFMNIYHGNMLTNIRFFRTIFKDYDEKLLFINYQSNDIRESIKFKNSTIIEYFRSKKNMENMNEDNFEVKFSNGKNTSLKINDSINGSYKKFNYSNLSDKIQDVSKEIDSLSFVEPVRLIYDDKLLVEVYKLFYNENPDFSDDDINIKVQAMAIILSFFNLPIGDYGFSLNKEKIPMSMSLYLQIYKLFPLGEVNEVIDPIKINDYNKRKIFIIGEEIRNSLNNNNLKETLISISRAIYGARWYFYQGQNILDIARNGNCNVSEVESCIKLVKTINTKIYD